MDINNLSIDDVAILIDEYNKQLKTNKSINSISTKSWLKNHLTPKKELTINVDPWLSKFLVLPELGVDTNILKSPVVNKPDVSTLTDEQLGIFNIITKINLYKFSQTLLTGYSGTGKSFLVSKIIEEILFTNKWVDIAITAPTNKAVRVLKNLSSICETNKKVSFNTLHSLLGLRRVITDDGREEYKPSDGGTIEAYGLIIVDEISMLDNEIYKLLIDSAKALNTPIIFIGDRGQIPPVNGGESLLFSSETNDLDNSFNLTKIIRQGQDNPIINLAQKIRMNEEFDSETIVDKDNNGVIFVKINTELPLLNTYFNSANFNKDPNFIKVLCWTNKAVDYYNGKIRELVYGINCGKLCIGEKMVCNKPITDSKNKVLLNNNDEFIVETFGLKKESLNPKISYYSVKINSNGKTHIIKILSENSESEYKKELDALKNKAINSTGLHKRNAWVKYYKFMEKYADVKYNYALTVHKAQGSTFDNAIVINCDISRIKDVVDKNKLLYTAITRAKNKLFIV